MWQTGRRDAGFTLAELVIVVLIVGLLAALAVPNVSGAIMRAKETALLENLRVMRNAIDDYHADKAAYPETLSDLVTQRYITAIPDDPVAGEDTPWFLIYDLDQGGVHDVRSAADGVGSNGIAYREW